MKPEYNEQITQKQGRSERIFIQKGKSAKIFAKTLVYFCEMK